MLIFKEATVRFICMCQEISHVHCYKNHAVTVCGILQMHWLSQFWKLNALTKWMRQMAKFQKASRPAPVLALH